MPPDVYKGAKGATMTNLNDSDGENIRGYNFFLIWAGILMSCFAFWVGIFYCFNAFLQ